MAQLQPEWPLRLFRKSVLKQAKYRAISGVLGPTAGLKCLDIGSDNGVVSLLLRQRGGEWKSADLDEDSLHAIRRLVGPEVCQIDGKRTLFAEGEFDRVVVVDFLEHIPGDAEFAAELFRILKPGGILVVNVPHFKPGLLRWFRRTIGLTDERHGHVRPGYTLESISQVLGSYFTIERHSTYSKFFSELIDSLITATVTLLQGNRAAASKKGLLITEGHMKQYRSLFRAYALIYPAVWLFAKMDSLLFFASGYMLLVTAKVKK